MHNKKIFLSFLLIFAIFNPLFAVSNTQIDTVRGKESIADADAAIIEEYVADVFAELMIKTDFSDASVLRNSIVSKSTSTNPTGKILYDAKYLAAFQNELKDASSKANAMKDGQTKTLLITNLLILSYDISNPDSYKTAADYLQNSSTLIRYWAAKNFENGNVIRKLNEGNEADRKNAASKILKAVQSEQSPEVLAIYAQFASGIKYPGGNEILTAIAQKRIDQYVAWTVKEEITDDVILKALADRTKTEPESTKTMAKYFASLLSVAIQRYTTGQQVIGDTSKGYLASVITQSDKYMPTFVPEWSGNFKRAIDKDTASLVTESDSAFGSASGSGKMPASVGFDYGKNADGTAKTVPPALSKSQANAN
ncbi:MAG: hypothetical protein A2Y12_14410 [Planctomycetes bacterium GWF2_42_9]|nr:MAG: hypothetical protein A2Y12_14410 [Planctomycetes bacterium GWF2_42_9]HAL45464.1 hypothetical protein [Phycisphaerales bacterium]